MKTRDKIIGMFLGVGIGDSLGKCCEGWNYELVRTTYGRIDRYIVPGGSDDTQLSLAVAEGLLLSSGKLDMDAQVKAHVKAFHESTQGWGPTTYGAVRRLSQGVPWNLAGARGGRITGTGNGTALKVAGAALLLLQDIPGAFEFIHQLCSMTHQTSLAVSAGLAHASGLAYCLETDVTTFKAAEFVKVVVDASMLGRAYFPDTLTEDDITERLALCGDYAEWPPERCVAEMDGGRSYVYCSLPFSYMFFLRNPTSVESLYDVVSMGSDADTNAGLVGALVGGLNGTAVFPPHLADELEASDRLVEMADRLCDLFKIV
ncbi:MAG: ADP-ribosylglycohydrolase family protein [Planctomycetes bacterium]|nr:ADP-ribosylglycohydrolase family protein [Planctomycetota bacterium]